MTLDGEAHQANSQTLTAAGLGFTPLPGVQSGWSKVLVGREVCFLPLRTVDDLRPVETLQHEVMGIDDRDLLAASALVTVPETGGEVIGAFLAATSERAPRELAGVVIGWGGFVAGQPRLVSDLLAVRAQRRNLGLGMELKRLQAAVALAAGFGEIVWTVDPLRAANARLNFEKLGATSRRYEEDRYGASFGAGFYGGLPTDRLHVHWQIDSCRVHDCLLGRTTPTTAAAVAGLAPYDPRWPAPRALVSLPTDVDRLLADEPAAVLRWRLRLREMLPAAFAAGYAITGFVPEVGPEPGSSSFLIERRGG